MTVVSVPDEPPVLGAGAGRALLVVLIDSAERELGPDWRQHLLGEQRRGPGSMVPTPGGVATRAHHDTRS